MRRLTVVIPASLSNALEDAVSARSAYRLIPYLSIGLLIFLIVVFAYALAENLRVLAV
jgi:hypothetical protein